MIAAGKAILPEMTSEHFKYSGRLGRISQSGSKYSRYIRKKCLSLNIQTGMISLYRYGRGCNL